LIPGAGKDEMGATGETILVLFLGDLTMVSKGQPWPFKSEIDLKISEQILQILAFEI
jgi:hypothetical protein